MTPTIIDIAKMAGLVEGEGWIGLSKGKREVVIPVMQIQMTDRDVVEWAAKMFGTSCFLNRREKPGLLAVWGTRAGGAKAVAWMYMLYPFLHSRRRQKIQSVINIWRSVPIGPAAIARIWSQGGQPAPRTVPNCHPEREHVALGLCEACYDKNHREPRKKVAMLS